MTRDEQARQRLVEIALLAAETEIGNRTYRDSVRERAGFRDRSKGSWCAAGLTAAMDQAGLLVPAPGTPARRGAIALLDFVVDDFEGDRIPLSSAQPGDIIAWLQHPQPDPVGWRRGHVAVIVAVDGESVTTIGWNEGASPGRVMMRRLWRDLNHVCGLALHMCDRCDGTGKIPRSSTVLWRRPGGLYGIARPVAA